MDVRKTADVQAAPKWPDAVMPAVLLAFGVVWVAFLGLLSRSPIVDNIEQLTWVRQLAWGYSKHPPFPTLLLWPFVQVFGLNAWVTYLLGAALTLGAVALMFAFLRRHRGTAFAAVATLAALCITYTSGSLVHYSHNTALLFFNMLAGGICFQALMTKQMRWFLMLGLVIGLGAISKYQIAVTVACVLCFVVLQGGWRDAAVWKGLVVGAGVAMLVFAPHLRWLVEHDFAPLRYAAESSLGASLGTADRLLQTVQWLGRQLLERLLPALLLLAFAAWSARRAARRLAAATSLPHANDPVRPLLLSWGLVPLVFMPLTGLLAGAHLQNHWGTAFLLLLPPALMECLRAVPWALAPWRRVMIAFIALQLLTLALTASSLLRHSDPLRAPWRRLDSQALADAMAAPARVELGGPIRVLSGVANVSGAISLRLPERPRVLMEGDFQSSPWVTPDLIARCGMVEVLRLNTASDLHPFGPAAPDMGWRTVRRKADAGPCPEN